MRLVSSLTQSITKNFLFSFFKVNAEDMLETKILLEQQLFNSAKSLEIPNKIDYSKYVPFCSSLELMEQRNRKNNEWLYTSTKLAACTLVFL